MITDIHQIDAFILDEKLERDAIRQVEGFQGEVNHFPLNTCKRKDEPKNISWNAEQPFVLSDISPAHGARRYHETGAVLSCSIDFSWQLSP